MGSDTQGPGHRQTRRFTIKENFYLGTPGSHGPIKTSVMWESEQMASGQERAGRPLASKGSEKGHGHWKASQAPGQGLPVLQGLEENVSGADPGSNDSTSQPGIGMATHPQVGEGNS